MVEIKASVGEVMPAEGEQPQPPAAEGTEAAPQPQPES